MITLNGQWKMKQVKEKEWHQGTVPGTVYTDLLTQGLIVDPYVGENEDEVRDLSYNDYLYEREFLISKEVLNNERNLLICKGIDTIADLLVNGKQIGICENMHREYEFDLTGFLKEGVNRIRVYFHSPMKYMQKLYEKKPLWGVTSTVPGYQYIRKAHCMFGWDWGVCLPDVSVYKELCSILGISLNEFLAGEDIAQENIIQKSETNIIEVIRDNINKQKCLKVMKCILVFIFICVVSVIGFTIYRLKKPQNYISPVAKDSIEMQTAELLAGSDGAFVYKFITTDKYKKLKLHIYRYESGKLSDQDKVEMGFEDSGSPKSGEIVMVPDFDNYVIKLIISGDGNKLSTEIPILENVEDREYYGRTATEIKNVVDVKYNEHQPLIAFVYDNDEMSVPTLDDFINSQIDFLSKNDYVYYVAFEFCK